MGYKRNSEWNPWIYYTDIKVGDMKIIIMQSIYNPMRATLFLVQITIGVMFGGQEGQFAQISASVKQIISKIILFK